MTTTHMLLPLAATLAIAKRPVPWKVVIVAVVASGAPDVDGLFKHFLHLPENSIYAHRGALHSLFAALAAGLIAACFHKRLEVRPLAAAVVVTAAMASHGILDMMTDSGQPVAYLWPLNSARLFADWRPIHSGSVHLPKLAIHSFAEFREEIWLLSSQAFVRLWSELWQIIVPAFAAAAIVRLAMAPLNRLRTNA